MPVYRLTRPDLQGEEEDIVMRRTSSQSFSYRVRAIVAVIALLGSVWLLEFNLSIEKVDASIPDLQSSIPNNYLFRNPGGKAATSALKAPSISPASTSSLRGRTVGAARHVTFQRKPGASTRARSNICSTNQMVRIQSSIDSTPTTR